MYGGQYVWLMERTIESQAYTFKELVVFLIGGYFHLVIVTFQYLSCDWQDWSNKLVSSLYTMPVNVIFAINSDNVLFIIERFGIAVCHACKSLEEKEVKIPVHYGIRAFFPHTD
jgi:hypothetical protein